MFEWSGIGEMLIWREISIDVVCDVFWFSIDTIIIDWKVFICYNYP